MRWVVVGLLVVGVGCTSGTVEVFDDGGPGDAGDDASDDDTPDDGNDDGVTTLPPPEIYLAPDDVARGGRIYLLTDELPRLLVLDVDGQPLGEPTDILHADLPGAIWRVPEGVALGPATLTVRRSSDLQARTTHPLTVHERRFVDVASEVGLGMVHDAEGSDPDCAESHTGLAAGDYDGDGATDLFVGNVGPTGGRLMRNAGDTDGDGLPDFVDATATSGLVAIDDVAMATFVDLEGDGDLDLFVGRRGPNRVLDNRLVPDGQARFVDVTAAVGLGMEDQRTMGVAFGDYDGDDDLDLYVVNHALCFPTGDSDVRASDHLYENDGGVFVERTEVITGAATQSVGFSASWLDFDHDGDQDLLVVNDAVGGPEGRPNAVWRNDGPSASHWAFTDVSLQSEVYLPGVNAMGLAIGDVDRDGEADLAFSNIGDNYLMLGRGDLTWQDVSEPAGVQRGWLPWDRESTTWAVHLLDHDNDGDLDLYFAGGRIKGIALVPDAFLDNEGAVSFTDRTWTSGLDDPGHGKASVLVDLDRDGAWDIVTAGWGSPLRVYHNRAPAPSAHWLDVDLVGRGANRQAIGAIVELSAGGLTQTCFHTNRPSLGGGGELTCHFGLGAATRVDAIRIVWPDGTSQPIPTLAAVDQRVTLVQP